MVRLIRSLSAVFAAGTLAAASFTLQPDTPPAATPPFSAAEFRDHHKEIQEHLDHLDQMARQLPDQSAERQKRSMKFVVDFLNEHIMEHAREEEHTLYTLADERVHPRFTETMRFEHTIAEKWIKELDAIQNQDAPDSKAFARRTQRLLGLLEAHFAAEEQVIVPAVLEER
jgi:hemerythrin-like domain-containing protein